MKNELSAEALALLEGAKRAGGPSLQRRAHLTASVMAAVESVPPPPGTPVGSALPRWGGWAVAGLVAVGGLTLALRPERPVARVQAEVTTKTQAPVTAEPIVDVAPALEVAVPTAPVSQPRRVLAAPPTSPGVKVVPSQVAPVAVAAPEAEPDELTSLDLSLAALDEGRSEDALRLARSARARFPAGAVRPELTLAEVLALCALGEDAQASAVAAAMPAVDQTSLVSVKLGRSCVGARP